MVDDDGVGGCQEALQPVRDLGELHPRDLEDLLEVLVIVDVFPFLRVLQPIGLRNIHLRDEEDWLNISQILIRARTRQKYAGTLAPEVNYP